MSPPPPPVLQVWVMTSTSGAAPMTREARYAPWQALAARLGSEPWPRRCTARCGSGGAASQAGSGHGYVDGDASSGRSARGGAAAPHKERL